MRSRFPENAQLASVVRSAALLAHTRVVVLLCMDTSRTIWSVLARVDPDIVEYILESLEFQFGRGSGGSGRADQQWQDHQRTIAVNSTLDSLQELLESDGMREDAARAKVKQLAAALRLAGTKWSAEATGGRGGADESGADLGGANLGPAGRGRILSLGQSPLLRGIGVPAPPVVSLRKQRSDEGKRIFADALDDGEGGGSDSDTEAQHEVARATTPEPTTQLETCAICWDHLEGGGDAAPLELCGHTFHAHCLASHIRTERQSLRIPVRCPSCPAHRAANASLLTDLDFSRLVSADERAALERGSVLRFVRDHGHLGRTKVRGWFRSCRRVHLGPR